MDGWKRILYVKGLGRVGVKDKMGWGGWGGKEDSEEVRRLGVRSRERRPEEASRGTSSRAGGPMAGGSRPGETRRQPQRALLVALVALCSLLVALLIVRASNGGEGAHDRGRP